MAFGRRNIFATSRTPRANLPHPLLLPRDTALGQLQKKVIACRRCPRLVRYLSDIRKRFPAYWCKPVPSFGDPHAEILFVGLAPGRFGSNRTGRMFTGDASGRFLFRLLYEEGLASRPVGKSADDGLSLRNAYISSVVRCAPPQNKPAPREIATCVGYLEREIPLLSAVRVLVALGKVAHDACLRMRFKSGELAGRRLGDFPFRHGAVYRFERSPHYLVDVYHPSRQNTQTGRLTAGMFRQVLRRAKALAMAESSPVSGIRQAVLKMADKS